MEDEYEYEERAAIMEYCGKMTRRAAEKAARKLTHVAVVTSPKKLGPSYCEFKDFWENRKKF